MDMSVLLENLLKHQAINTIGNPVDVENSFLALKCKVRHPLVLVLGKINEQILTSQSRVVHGADCILSGFSGTVAHESESFRHSIFAHDLQKQLMSKQELVFMINKHYNIFLIYQMFILLKLIIFKFVIIHKNRKKIYNNIYSLSKKQ